MSKLYEVTVTARGLSIEDLAKSVSDAASNILGDGDKRPSASCAAHVNGDRGYPKRWAYSIDASKLHIGMTYYNVEAGTVEHLRPAVQEGASEADARLTDAELAALLERASPGPWAESCLGSEGYAVNAPPDERKRRRRVAFVGFGQWEQDKADAELIAAMRNALPSLLAERSRVVAAAELTDAELAHVIEQQRLLGRAAVADSLCELQATRATIAQAAERERANERDAMLWRGLMAADRIRFIGSGDDYYCFEVWGKYPDAEPEQPARKRMAELAASWAVAPASGSDGQREATP